MAQILAPSAQWQMRIAKSSTEASPMASKVWGSVVMKPNKRLAVKSSAKFRVFALQPENSTVNRMEQLLNLDVTPYTDKIIAEYICQLFGILIIGNWNGAGCHTNYSTKSMREEGGFEVIKKAILNLSLRHLYHISAYGEGNERRELLTDTEKNGKGYLEDRRPASNMDPYVVSGDRVTC
ncbi:glutamine synthetase, chloroplastic-like [Ipomoea triloba]|uniref:glutamine synthetase, chloroplastic-like n=1 Tax=Ipomoea triloba TaxID=35885 RepID=UPI00125D9D03|nr:glutamine synthetase, chloroplastic-like [Ipomoea triloba]